MRYAIAIEYNGSEYCGWQRQTHSVSVQEDVEKALSIIADHEITVICAGRTDTGVHAQAQIAHFDTHAERDDRAWTFGANTHLKKAVSIHWVAPMPHSFHARFCAIERSYRYTILNRSARPGYQREYVNWVNKPLMHEAMHAAAQFLLGRHDFSAFRSADCQAPHAERDITRITVSRDGEYIYIDVVGNAFLHNMVRIIAGTLIKVGTGERPAEWIRDLLSGRDRSRSGMTAPPGGLCFLQPKYPPEYGVPLFRMR